MFFPDERFNHPYPPQILLHHPVQPVVGPEDPVKDGKGPPRNQVEPTPKKGITTKKIKERRGLTRKDINSEKNNIIGLRTATRITIW